MTWMKNGKVQTDSAIFNTAAPSMRMTPTGTPVFTGSTTSGSPTIALNTLSIYPLLSVGDLIVGTSSAFPVGTKISSLNPAAGTITASANAGATIVNDSFLYGKKLESAPQFQGMKVAVASGSSAGVSVYIKKRAENLFTFSEDFSNAVWGVTASTPTTGQADPLGGSNATNFLETTANNNHGVTRSTAVSTVVGQTYTMSFYVKKLGSTQWLRIADGASRNSWADILNGVAGTINAAHTLTITAVGSFYRITLTYVGIGTAPSPQVFGASADNNSAIYVGNVSNGFVLFGMQYENGSVASPYQVTTASNQPGYNGSQPRLILKANPAIGVANDTVIATASAAAGTWAQISGTTAAATDDGVMEFTVDCDGTTGWINVDDWSFS
jgi:hypothetical protein